MIVGLKKTLGKSIGHLRRVMRKHYGVFLAVSLLLLAELLVGCASSPRLPMHEKFDGHWSFCEVTPHETQACLSKEDVAKLLRLLNHCRSGDSE